jgi:hypothetical protein
LPNLLAWRAPAVPGRADREVSWVGTISNSYGIANEEAGGPIFISRSPKRPLSRAWLDLKRLD